ncbi:hypothetical protein MKX03_017676 [Papaver bracteatum]|nr:hypothetical protein MKX03_017676 [Papaver bracteatum]
MPSSIMPRILFVLLFTMMIILQNSNGQMEEWCIADEQTPHDVLQMALDWACGRGGADCSKIQRNKSCYNPNTLLDHASYAFNSYYQKFKKQGATCYFRSAAMISNLDPSHNSCKFEYIP